MGRGAVCRAMQKFAETAEVHREGGGSMHTPHDVNKVTYRSTGHFPCGECGWEGRGIGAVLAVLTIILISIGFNSINRWGLLRASPAAPFGLLGLSPAPIMQVTGFPQRREPEGGEQPRDADLSPTVDADANDEG
jgi:hypothetical protein